MSRKKKNHRVRPVAPLSRRTFLRGSLAGLGLGLALPPLEAMLDSKGAYADGQGEKPFFLLFFWGGGLPWNDKHGTPQMGHPDLWTPAESGAGFTPTELLTPLAPYNVNVLTGLQPVTEIPSSPAGQADGHMRGFMVAMTGDRPRSEGFDHPSHTLTALRPSLDQLVAKHSSYYTNTPVYRSLQVGVSTARFHDYGHWNAISYNGPDSLNEPIMQPTQLFDQLFSVDMTETDDDALDRSRALDAVLGDAQALKQKLGTSDRARVDAHLEHVSEIQRRLTLASATCGPTQRPSNSGSLIERTRTMAELVAMAIQCGQTKVVSFMLTSPASTHLFSNVGAQNEMHKTVHDGEWQTIRDITRHQMECFGALLDVFAATDTPSGGKLIDDGVIYGTSEYGEGYQHNVKELPVVLAGGACGALLGGRHVRVPAGNVSRAQLTALQALGLPFTSFGFNGGETSSPFSELLA